MADQPMAKGKLKRSARPPQPKAAPIGAAAPPDLTGMGAAPPPAMGDMMGGGAAMPMGGPAGGPALPPPTGLGVLGGGGAGFKPSDLVKKGRSKKKGE